jgi:hypothetical protein
MTKSGREVMEIFEAFDLTGISPRGGQLKPSWRGQMKPS